MEPHDISMNDVQDIIYSLLPVETIIGTDSFLRVALPFRLLRRCLNMHLVNPIKNTMLNCVSIAEEDLEDVPLFEHIWFLLLYEHHQKLSQMPTNNSVTQRSRKPDPLLQQGQTISRHKVERNQVMLQLTFRTLDSQDLVDVLEPMRLKMVAYRAKRY